MKISKKIAFLSILQVVLLITPSVSSAVLVAGSAGCVFLKNLEGVLTGVSATLVVIGWIIAGILWLTSLGSTERMGVARKAVTAAIIGTVVVIIAGTAYAVINSFLGGGGPASTC